MGCRVNLKDARHLLARVLADGLDVTVGPYGGPVNPPCVVTRPAPSYVEATGYCTDKVNLEAVILPGPGEGAATVDALDDLIDKIRGVLLIPLSDGFRFSFAAVNLSPPGEDLYAVVDITYERNDD